MQCCSGYVTGGSNVPRANVAFTLLKLKKQIKKKKSWTEIADEDSSNDRSHEANNNLVVA